MTKPILIFTAIVLIFLYSYNPTPETFKLPSRPISSLSSIGLFIVANDAVANRFDQYIGSLACYAYRHSYRFILIHSKQYPSCIKTAQSIYFQKHCLLLMYLLDNTQIQWLVALDLDILVMNMSKKFESYLPDATNQSAIHLIFYERFNGEIAAGNYIIRNHPWSHTFLSRWLQFERQTRHFKFHNHDNGPLHLHLLGSMVGNVSQSAYDRCLRIYEKTNNHTLYHTYVGCCKCALGGRWEFDHVRILRRGHSFVRDNLGHDMSKRIWSPTDFCIHGHRQNIGAYYSKEVDVYQCIKSNWSLPIREDVIMKNYAEVQEIIRRFDREAAQAYPQSIGLPDISDCWPYCINTEARRQAFMNKVCHRNATWRSF